MCGNVLLDAGPQVLLEFHAFRTILLHKIDAGHSAIEVGLEAQFPRQILGGETQSLERRRGFANIIIHDRFNVIARIVDDDRKTVRKKNRRPRGSDYAGADDGNFE